MRQYDDIQFLAVGIVGQPAIDWQNRPTFQQVVEFPEGLSAQVPETPISAVVPLAGVVARLVAGAPVTRRRHRGGTKSVSNRS